MLGKYHPFLFGGPKRLIFIRLTYILGAFPYIRVEILNFPSVSAVTLSPRNPPSLTKPIDFGFFGGWVLPAELDTNKNGPTQIWRVQGFPVKYCPKDPCTFGCFQE